jgi:hypothetical protein
VQDVRLALTGWSGLPTSAPIEPGFDTTHHEPFRDRQSGCGDAVAGSRRFGTRAAVVCTVDASTMVVLVYRNVSSGENVAISAVLGKNSVAPSCLVTELPFANQRLAGAPSRGVWTRISEQRIRPHASLPSLLVASRACLPAQRLRSPWG